MPRSFLALLVVAAVFALEPAAAIAGEGAFCIKGCDFGGARGDCSFSSYQQCQATASGRDATCAANPNFNVKASNAKAEMLPGAGRLSRRKL